MLPELRLYIWEEVVLIVGRTIDIYRFFTLEPDITPNTCSKYLLLVNKASHNVYATWRRKFEAEQMLVSSVPRSLNDIHLNYSCDIIRARVLFRGLKEIRGNATEVVQQIQNLEIWDLDMYSIFPLDAIR